MHRPLYNGRVPRVLLRVLRVPLVYVAHPSGVRLFGCRPASESTPLALSSVQPPESSSLQPPASRTKIHWFSRLLSLNCPNLIGRGSKSGSKSGLRLSARSQPRLLLLITQNHMSCAFDFDSTNRILRSRLAGKVSDEEFIDFYRGISRRAIHLSPSAGIIDLSGVTSFDVSVQVMGTLATLPSVVQDPNFLRIVIAPSSETFAMMRMFGTAGEQAHPNVKVVQTERDAWALLSVNAPRFDPLPPM